MFAPRSRALYRKQTHLAELTNAGNQRFNIVDLWRSQNKLLPQTQRMALAISTHSVIFNAVEIGHVCQADSATNQLRAAIADCVMPYDLQELGCVALFGQRRILCFIAGQLQETFRETEPQRT